MILLGWLFTYIYIYIYGFMASIMMLVFKEKIIARKNILKISLIATFLFEAYQIKSFIYYQVHYSSFVVNHWAFRCISLIIGILPLLWLIGFNEIINFTNKNKNKIMKGDN